MYKKNRLGQEHETMLTHSGPTEKLEPGGKGPSYTCNCSLSDGSEGREREAPWVSRIELGTSGKNGHLTGAGEQEALGFPSAHTL